MTHDRKTSMIEMFWFFHHDSTTSVRMTQMSAVLYTSSTILDIAKKNTKNCRSWMELRNWKHKCQHQTNHFVCQWFLKFFFWNMSPYRLHPKHHEREEHANYHVFQSQDFAARTFTWSSPHVHSDLTALASINNSGWHQTASLFDCAYGSQGSRSQVHLITLTALDACSAVGSM